jgi:hypothetical protein
VDVNLPEPDIARSTAHRWLAAVCILNLAIAMIMHAQMPLPPHSSHDGFLLVPQLQHLISGATPDEPLFGMFSPTWFSPHSLSGGSTGWAGFFERVFGNVQSHTWIDAPHPLAIAAAISSLVPGGTWVPALVLAGYLLVLMVGLYDIGTQVVSRRVGIMAAIIATGCPALFGTARYIEPHLPIAALSTLVVALLLRTRGLRFAWTCVFVSITLWTLSRTGEGSGDAVIAGLIVIGPVFATIVQSDRTLSGFKWVLGFLGLSVPFLYLADLGWMVDAMERVTRAFADPSVQTDVVEKGGVLSHPLGWMSSYGILIVTDYLRPALALFIPLGLWGLLRAKVNHRWVVGLWFLVPFLALSWMQRKASWYGIGLVPPFVLWLAIGVDSLKMRWLSRSVMGTAIMQLLLFSFVSESVFSGATAFLREPAPLHDWRLRRIDLLRPMDSDADQAVVSDLDEVVSWMRSQEETRPIALVTMGTQHDYASRYYLSMNLPGVEVINLMDPRVRKARYRSLHPDDFSLFIFMDGGLNVWPPDSQQMTWLRSNMRCVEDDPLDRFLGAVMDRTPMRLGGMYVLTSRVGGELEAGQLWSGLRQRVSPGNGFCGE